MRRLIYWNGDREHWYARPVPDQLIHDIETRRDLGATLGSWKEGGADRCESPGVGRARLRGRAAGSCSSLFPAPANPGRVTPAGKVAS